MKKFARISSFIALGLILVLAVIYMLLRNQYSASTITSGAEICDNGIDDNGDGIVDGCWDPDKTNYQPSGRIYYVSPSGNDSNQGTQAAPFKTINKATSQVKAGEAVYVLPGVYKEHVEFTNAGTPSSPILLKGVGANGSIIVRRLDNEADTTDFRGIKPRSNTIIDNMMTDGVQTLNSAGRRSRGGYGIILSDVQNILIKNCIVQQHDTGIRAEVGSRLIVRNTVMRNCEAGTYMGTDNNSGPSLEFADTLWENDKAIDPVRVDEKLDGFLVEGNVSHHIFRNCVAAGWSDAGFDLKGHVIVENSIAYNNHGEGVGEGFKIWRDGLVRNSIAYDNSYANFLFGGLSPDWKLVNSLSYNGRVSFEKRAESSSALSNSTIKLSHNIFVNTTFNDEIGGAFTYADHNLFYGGSIPNPTGAASKTAHPAFVNEAGRDFHLVANSAPIDAGSAALTSYMLTTDLDGKARKIGNAVDIGPYEYQSATSPDSGGDMTNRPPVFAPIANVTTSGEAKFTVSASDPDNDAIALSAQNLPAGATFNASTGAFSWVSSLSQRSIAGTSYDLTFQARDSRGAVATAKVTVTLKLFAIDDRKLQIATTTRRCVAPCSIDFMATANVGGQITKYTWTFGDGTSSNGQSASHTYTNPGSYNVTIDIYTRILTHIRSSFYVTILAP